MINSEALRLIKEFEGFEAEAYKDPVGIVTIGYGSTAAAGVGISPKMGDKITEAQATDYLKRAVDKFAAQIMPKITRTPTGNQFGAMVSLAYNIGPGAFIKSTVLRRFNAGDIQGAADAFLMWNKAGGKVLAGLTRRRKAERELFLTPDNAEKLMPTSVDVKQTPKIEHVAPVMLPKPSFWAQIIAVILAILKGLKK